ncbi:HlyD family secretion protein [Psychromonas aquimarina]|uniref:HlyD family secretion protein n=1 Tax=Psychromonas aquimarina TaxID=444919 RepID=UPI0003F4E6A1|nr:efflux RND transporter periplasmic adaptor subunit [Psychromonas aquimarina]
MLEGLAVWSLFIFLLRLVGMPWNKFSKIFAYLGGTLWLLFVWVGLLNFTPMDMSGGSLVQSPHIQLRPASSQVKGYVKAIYIKPNERVSKGQLVYELEDEPFQIAVNQAQVDVDTKEIEVNVALEEVLIAEQKLESAQADISISEAKLNAAERDFAWKKTTLERYITQNNKAPDTVTRSTLDEQQTSVTVAQAKVNALISELKKSEMTVTKNQLEIKKSKLKVKSEQTELARAVETLAQQNWNLDSTKIYAPDDGYVTNFIMREGQYIGAMPRIQMYTDEKYVLMRVNHQAIRNVKVGQKAEFTSAVYPGKIFNARVEGIIEATGESQGSLVAKETNVRQTTALNASNKHHLVRLKIDETQGRDLPVGAVGLAWISGEKPMSFLDFLDPVRGIIIRMKSQIYFFYSM